MQGTSRRTVLFGMSAFLAVPTFAAKRQTFDVESDFKRQFQHIDFRPRGPGHPEAADIDTANLIIGDYLPYDNPYDIMKKLSELNSPENRHRFKSTTGYPFNQRWPDKPNPLLIRFFQDTGYPNPPYSGDCTPWCAATVSWCLNRAHFQIPANSASSQSFKYYGTAVDSPEHGDLCVFGIIGDPSHGHIGFFNGMAGDNAVNVLGGNQGGKLPTRCAAGYPQSKITSLAMPINRAKNLKVGNHYLIKYVRPTRA